MKKPLPVVVVSLGPLVWTFLGLLVLVAVLWVAAKVRVVSVPLVVGFVIAYLLDPLVERMARRGINRTVGILLLVFGFVGVMTGVGFLVAPMIAEGFAELPAAMMEAGSRGLTWLNETFGLELPATTAAATEAMMGAGDGQVILRRVGTFLFGSAATVFSVVTGMIMVPIFAFFLLRDFDRILAWFKGLLPPAHRHAVGAHMATLDKTVGAFVRGQLMVAAVLAVLYSVGLWLVGLQLAVVVGIIAGIGNMVPYVGTIIGIALATVMVFLDWNGWLQLILVYVVFAAVQTLEGTIITPRIVGHAVGLSAFWVIVAVLVFGDLLGFLGVVIAVPLAAILQMVARVVISRYRESSAFNGD